MKLTPFTRIVLIVFLGVVLLVAATFVLILPSLNRIDTLNKDLVAKKTEISNLEQQIRAYQTAQSDLNRAVDKQEIFDAFLPKEKLVTVIKEMESAVANSGTGEEVLSIDDPFLAAATGQPATKNAKKEDPTLVGGLNNITLVPYELNFSNDYLGTIRLLSYLEHLPHFTEFSSFHFSAQTITPAAGTSQTQVLEHTGKISGTIKGIFYARKEVTTPTTKNATKTTN
ncbi:MAG: hypothetical protein KW788_02225 [Candidatus Doudnabacteria bacterium]|nr:hypothetical protein [Candidatus Doudnabacteria bacterium]